MRREPLPCPSGLDPLVQKAYHNVAVSPLCRIPDELLIKIMRYLGSTDLASLRRTSRIFLRLFEDNQFRFFHTPDLGPWPRTAYLNFVEKGELRTLLLKDKYCGPCRAVKTKARNGPLRQALCRSPLYCAGCSGSHSSGLFSPSERAVGDPRKRVCIAHEGYLRVCQHRIITWANIQRWTSFLGPDTSFYSVLVCGAQSHLSQCGDRPGEPAGSGGVMVKLALIGSSKIKMTVEWGVHASVPHRKGASGTYDADDVRKIAEGLHADAGQYIVPRFQPDQPPHMAAFDPNLCGCLQYPGRGMLDWQMAPESDIHDCCRKSKSRALFTSRNALWKGLGVLWGRSEGHAAKYNVGPTDKLRYHRIAFRRCCAEAEGMGVLVTHRYSFELSCRPRQWPPDPRESTSPPPEWYRIMDPASYGLEGDEASRNFLWCGDEKCANHVDRAIEVDRFRSMSSLKRPSR